MTTMYYSDVTKKFYKSQLECQDEERKVLAERAKARVEEMKAAEEKKRKEAEDNEKRLAFRERVKAAYAEKLRTDDVYRQLCEEYEDTYDDDDFIIELAAKNVKDMFNRLMKKFNTEE